MNQIVLLLKNESSLDSIRENINPNFVDENGNGIYHYFSEYSLEKFYILNYNKYKTELIKEEKFKEIIKEYKSQIPLYIEILDELKCDKFSLNKMNQSPLIYSIINKNYYIAKEYIKIINDMNLLKENIIYEVFKLCLNNGDCLRKDCLQLIYYILFLAKEKNIKICDESFQYKMGDNSQLSAALLLSKDFSENLHEKFNQILQIKSTKYSNLYYGTNTNALKENFLVEILRDSELELEKFINELFYPLLKILIKLEIKSNYRENYYLINSIFINLISFPVVHDLFLFFEEFHININYQDDSGQTPLMHLISNQKKMNKISKKYYDKTFEYIINYTNLKIEVTDDNQISAFGLSLMKGCFLDSFEIYTNQKFIKNRLFFNNEILIFIINYINEQNEYKRIIKFFEFSEKIKMKYFTGFDFENFNDLNKRSLFHYFIIYSSEDNKKFYIYKILYYILIKIVDIDKKDIFQRNPLFYFFIDDNEKIKKCEPFSKLELCLKNEAIKNLNETDIYGNSLIFYAVQAKAYKSINLLVEYGASLDLKNKDGNTIYSIASILGDYKLFSFLYNIKKDNKIFLQKVYSFHQFDLNDNEQKNEVQSLIEIYSEMKASLPNSKIIIEELEKNYEQKYLENKNYFCSKIESKFKSDYISLINDDLIILINENIKEIKNQKEFDNINFYISLKKSMDIKVKFMKDLNDYIKKINNEKSSILSETLFQYCKLKKFENICGFILKENYHLISICNDLFSLKDENELKHYIYIILKEKDLLNYKNEEDITIFHILAKMKNKKLFYKENNIDKYKISSLFDNLGNTPIYYACHKLNIDFIETFSNYSFSSINNDPQKVNYSLFIETKNTTSPLKSLYLQINTKDINIIKLIVDISINTKKVYILHILLFLIKNYKPLYLKYFGLSYIENLKCEDYIRKIIGLYLFYTKELNGSFSQEEFPNTNPIFYCANFKNFNFLFDVLSKEKNIEINSRNKEGKNIIHFIVDLKEDPKKKDINKKDILYKALELGFDYEAKDNNGKQPIYYAILNKDEEMRKILIQKYGPSLYIAENNNQQ